MDASDRELLWKYLKVVFYLLETYAIDDHKLDAYQNRIVYHQSPTTSEMDYANHLWTRPAVARLYSPKFGLSGVLWRGYSH